MAQFFLSPLQQRCVFDCQYLCQFILSHIPISHLISFHSMCYFIWNSRFFFLSFSQLFAIYFLIGGLLSLKWIEGISNMTCSCVCFFYSVTCFWSKWFCDKKNPSKYFQRYSKTVERYILTSGVGCNILFLSVNLRFHVTSHFNRPHANTHR